MTEEKDKEGPGLSDVRKFLSTEDNPVTMAEFTAFWKELTDEEKEDFKRGLPPKE